MAEYLALLGQLGLILVPLIVVVLFLVLLGTEFYIKRVVRGATLLIFWNPNREMVFNLVKTEGRQTVSVGEGTYTLIPERQFSVSYPFWAPSFMQERVPVYYFKPDGYEAIDPTVNGDVEKLMTAQMLRDVTDEAMLKATVKEAREAAEGVLATNRSFPLYILIACGLIIIMVGVDIYFQFQSFTLIQELGVAVLE